MNLILTKPLKVCLFFCFLFRITFSEANTPPTAEFRGVWVASVTNIDWPSKRNLSVEELKKEALDIITMHEDMGMNTIILQVRPSGDAIYPSRHAPWSVYLTGKQGLAPPDSFDPLRFWVEECNKRNIELHAWINPFRASLHSSDSLHISHQARIHPEWIVEYNKRLYFDPGIEEVRQHIIEVIEELVSNYNIAAIHIDDYFYPYPVAGETFNDSATYARWTGDKSSNSIHDWRRLNIDLFIKDAYDSIHKIKPWVKFGISPFGVWRNRGTDPRGSDSNAGVTSYDNLYANVVRWAELGWIDYVIPQIYWSTRDEAANFIKLAEWWNQNITTRHLYIGHGIYKINGTQEHWDNPDELREQINFTRSLDNVKGNAFYSHNHFKRENNNLNRLLGDSLYREAAIAPPMEWLNISVPKPVMNLRFRRGLITWEAPASSSTLSKPKGYLVYITNEMGEEINHFVRGKAFKPESKNMPGRGRFEIEIAVINDQNSVSERSEAIKIKF